MNQILIAEKVYITPELKRKKRMYKIDFFISVFLVFILSSYYIYAEYDKNKTEEKAQEILSSVRFNSSLVDDTTIKFEENSTLVILNEDDEAQVVILSTADEETGEQEQYSVEDLVSDNIRRTTMVTDGGQKYFRVAEINIPKINCNYAVLCTIDNEYTWTDELLKISPCYFWGAKPNEPGNFCIVGHNYRNTKFFSKVPTLTNGDTIEITDLTGTTVKYAVYDKYTVYDTQTECTSQETGGKTEITLITCTNDGSKRVIVKARKVGE
ncbi:MAG: sortase [Clostridia bacterium]|nr:sortase [Clostridia bacterium]